MIRCQAKKGETFNRCKNHASEIVGARNLARNEEVVSIFLCACHKRVFERENIGIVVEKWGIDYHAPLKN